MKNNSIHPLLALVLLSAAAPAFAATSNSSNVTSVTQVNSNTGNASMEKSTSSHRSENSYEDGRRVIEETRRDEEVKNGVRIKREETLTKETDANHNTTETVVTVESTTDPATGKTKIHRIKKVNGKTVQDETVEEPAPSSP